MTATSDFTRKLKAWIKLNNNKSVDDYSPEIEKALNEIKSLSVAKNLALEKAEKYFQDKKAGDDFDSGKNIFKKYKPFRGENLHFIFIICSDCEKTLKCLSSCHATPQITVCLYDIFYET